MNDSGSKQQNFAQAPRKRQRLPWLATLIVVAAIVAIVLAIILPAVQSTRRRPLPPAVKKIREIERALGQYFHEHGRLPFDERGPSFALYKLHTFVDADVFLLNDDERRSVRRHAAIRTSHSSAI